jgi:hypothetical protein
VINVRITNTGQLLQLQRRLRAAGNESLRASMQRRVRRAAEPLRDDLKSGIRGNPIRGTGGSGAPSTDPRPLRATIAAAIRISVRNTGGGAGARVWIDKGALPADYRTLPNHIESGSWRHKVFGNRRVWTTSYSSPWWDKTVQKHEPRMRAEIERVLDDVRNRLGG